MEKKHIDMHIITIKTVKNVHINIIDYVLDLAFNNVNGPCDFSVSLSPFGLDFGTLDFGTSDSGLTIRFYILLL